MVSKGHLVIGTLILLIITLINLSNFNRVSGMSSVSASQHYGIIGHPAPELNLTGWIDGQGKQIDPIKLQKFRYI
jgi:hypothetical protein